ncbi:MAG TPA: hypothetical protein PL110_15640 [Candidatus Eremiobacteraeota bacterium]|nr:hypothetical protein [Candidatus Eremiobacteraeota bacterium]
MRNRLRNSKALTVLEVMLSCIIFSMLAGIVFYIFVVSAKSWLKVRKQVEVSESAQVIISRIERDKRKFF